MVSMFKLSLDESYLCKVLDKMIRILNVHEDEDEFIGFIQEDLLDYE